MALSVNEVYRLSEYEEVLGVLHCVENTDMGLIAVIGKISVLLPDELAENLLGLVGQKIAILRLDGYHTRCINKEMHKVISQNAVQGVVAQI
jgi:predicted aspartyl protease